MNTEPTRYWEDLQPGETFVSSERQISEREIIEFSRRYDPQYFHVDPEKARESRFGELIASGIQVIAEWRILEHQCTGDVRWICGIGWDGVRWKLPLRAGDRVRSRSELQSKRPSGTDRGRGITVHRYSLLNQDDEEIFHCTSTALVERRPG